MADIPDGIVVSRDRDLVGRRHGIWLRRVVLALLATISALALANLFGQRPQTLEAGAAVADLQAEAPARVRAGLLFQARFRITAHQVIRRARLVLEPGWLESMSISTIEPAPSEETSDEGRLSLELGRISGGSTYTLFMQFQTNPTNVGHREASVTLFDGSREIAHINRSITIFP